MSNDLRTSPCVEEAPGLNQPPDAVEAPVYPEAALGADVGTDVPGGARVPTEVSSTAEACSLPAVRRRARGGSLPA